MKLEVLVIQANFAFFILSLFVGEYYRSNMNLVISKVFLLITIYGIRMYVI